jgi:hypothetical protein
VTASNEGVPETLGTTSGGGRPSVVAWEDRGYVVAYGASGGGVSLHFVPPLPEPPTYDGISGAVDDRTGQELGPIPGIVDLGSIGAPGGAPDHVALAIGAHEGGELALGIAWLSGCGEGGEGIVFRRVALTVAGDAPTGIAGTRDAARLGEAPDGEILGSPAVIYQRSGFVVEGFERGGAVAGASRTGGFVVAWATGLDTDGDGRPDARGRMLATRVAALDGAPVDAAERIDLTQGDAANAWEPHLFGADGFAYWNRAAGTIVAGELACPPR